MKLINQSTPTTPWSAFVAPTYGGSLAGVCPQGGIHSVDVDAQAGFTAVGDAGMNAGYRPWRPLIT